MINKTKISQKRVLKLINKIRQLEPMEFIGLLNLFSISLDSENKEPKDFYELLDEVIEKYYTKDRKFRRKVNQILNAAISKEKK